MPSIKITVAPGVEFYTVEGLPQGKYDLLVSAVNSAGVGSVVKTINDPGPEPEKPATPVVE